MVMFFFNQFAQKKKDEPKPQVITLKIDSLIKDIKDIYLEQVKKNDSLIQKTDKKGPAENKGCPFEDSDNDGTPDKDDDCDDEYGPRRNDGCPYDSYEPESYLTECPYCGNESYETTTDRYWNCGSCSKRFYNCFKTDDYGGVRIEWFNDGDCDCTISCYDED